MEPKQDVTSALTAALRASVPRATAQFPTKAASFPARFSAAATGSSDYSVRAAWAKSTDLTLEPALRSRRPHSIITWNRVLTGRWNSAQVWAHVLIGAAVRSLMWTADATRLAVTAYSNGLDATDGLFLLTGTR